MRIISLGIFLALLAPEWTLSAGSAAPTYRILCLGESTTAPTVAPDYSWPRQLEDLLNKKHPGKFIVLNHLPEADSAIIDKALPSYLERYKPDLLIVMVGKGNLPRLVSIAQSRQVRLMLMHYPGIAGAVVPAALKNAKGIVFVDHKKSFDRVLAGGRYEDYFLDRSFGRWGHGTAKGNLLVAENAAQVVLGIFRDVSADVKMAPEERAGAYRRIAQEHDTLDDAAGSLGSLGLLLELLPDDRDALRRMTEISLDADRMWEALSYADRAKADGEAGLIRLYLGDRAGAEENIGRALRLKPHDPELLLLLAQAKRDRPDDALSYAQQAARAENAAARLRASAYLLAGELQADLADKPGAQDSFKRALELSADDLDAMQALVRLHRGQKEKAIVYAERAALAAGKAPLWRQAAAYRYSARMWAELEEYPRAAGNLLRALKLAPYDFDALLMLVQIQNHLPQDFIARARAEARAAQDVPEPPVREEDELLRVLEKDDGDLDALWLLIELRSNQGRILEACALAHRFERAVLKAPLWQQASAHELIGRLWRDLGRGLRASQSLTRALTLNPDAIMARRMILGLRRPLEEDSVFGVADIRGFSFRYLRVAQMRYELKDYSGAKESLKLALVLNPDNSGAVQLQDRLKREHLN